MKRKSCSRRERARAHDRGLAAFAAFNRRCAPVFGAPLPRNPPRKLSADDERRLVIADEYLSKTPPGDRGYRAAQKIVKDIMFGKCNRAGLARKLREVRKIKVADEWRPLRDHLLRLAIDAAKRGRCTQAGREVARARKISEENPK